MEASGILKKQFIKFVLVGIVSTVLNYLVFYMSFEALKINYLISSACGFISGVLLGFFLNKDWTFEGNETDSKDLLKYIGVYCISLIISLLFLKYVVVNYGINSLIGNIFAIGITTCTNFAGIKLFVFKR